MDIPLQYINLTTALKVPLSLVDKVHGRVQPVDEVAVEDEVELAERLGLLHGGGDAVRVGLVRHYLVLQAGRLDLGQ